MFTSFYATTDSVIRSPSKTNLLEAASKIIQVLTEAFPGQNSRLLISNSDSERNLKRSANKDEIIHAIDVSRPMADEMIATAMTEVLATGRTFLARIYGQSGSIGEMELAVEPILRWQITLPVRANQLVPNERHAFVSSIFSLIDRDLIQSAFLNWSDLTRDAKWPWKRSGLWVHGSQWWLFVFEKLRLLRANYINEGLQFEIHPEKTMRLVSATKVAAPDKGLVEFEYNRKNLKSFIAALNREFEMALQNDAIVTVLHSMNISPNEWLALDVK